MTEYQYKKVFEALNSKLKPCSGCGLPETFIVASYFYMLKLSDSPETASPMSHVLPAVVITCSNCGLIQIHNTHVLGISEVLGIPEPGVAL